MAVPVHGIGLRGVSELMDKMRYRSLSREECVLFKGCSGKNGREGVGDPVRKSSS